MSDTQRSDGSPDELIGRVWLRFESTDDLERHTTALAQVSALSRAAERAVGPVQVTVKDSTRSRGGKPSEWPSSLAFALWADYTLQVQEIARLRDRVRRRQLQLEPAPAQHATPGSDARSVYHEAGTPQGLWTRPQAGPVAHLDVEALEAGKILETLTERAPALWDDQLLALAAEGRVDPRRVKWAPHAARKTRFVAERIHMESPLELVLTYVIGGTAALGTFTLFVKGLRKLYGEGRGLQLDHLEANNAARRLRIESQQLEAIEREGARGLDAGDRPRAELPPGPLGDAGGEPQGPTAPELAEARVSIEERSGAPGPAAR